MSRVSLPRRMRRRTAATAALAVVATIALVGCENKASTAAFVGEHRISDQDLRRTVDDALAHPAVKKLVDERLGDNAIAAYRRVILDNEVQHMLVEQAADRLDVDVTSSVVDDRLAQIAAGAGADVGNLDDLFASNGLTPEAGRRVVRDEALLTEIGYASGAPRADEAELRRSYEAAKPQFTSLTLGIIQVPDNETAQSVLGQLRETPDSYPDLAAQHADGATMPQPQKVSLDQINPTLLEKLEPVDAGDGIVFSQPAQAGGPGLFAVIYLVNREVAPFESVRSQLEADKIAAAQSAANTYLSKLAKELKVRVNPRYGKWDYTQNHIADLPDPLVKLPSPNGADNGAGQPQPQDGGQGAVPPEAQQPEPQN